ncbi:hypothetical protein RJT34_29805 [Clitoria ternatea]|uniref:C2H2-type domain-containing protein n=1 Tax=Clitoria ternatea TaxID=43366 RepID=A0AAN9ERL8_CLITE
MMPKATSGFSSDDNSHSQIFPMTEFFASPSIDQASSSNSGSHSSTTSLLFYLSLLKDKFLQLQNLVGVVLSPEHNHLLNSTSPSASSTAISTVNSIIQDIIVAATSMRFTFQQIPHHNHAPPGTTTTNQLHHHQQQIQHNNNATILSPQHHHLHHHHHHQSNHDNRGNNLLSNINMIGSDINIRGQTQNNLFCNISEAEELNWFAGTYNNNCNNLNNNSNKGIDDGNISGGKSDIIELDAADLLARYTHFCQVCGKGFKRDANLRMHMRAHGDEYKSSAALSNPMKGNKLLLGVRKKLYSCPQEGCRWNKKHEKFQPLKSMICVKNHYKRSHCPKMYMCNRCNMKQFSVLSDLRTHEKHCGDPKWQCSCGTTFSRKDKLIGHLALFLGHTPAANTTALLSCSGKSEEQALEQQQHLGGASI